MREEFSRRGAVAVIPPKADRKDPIDCDFEMYKWRSSKRIPIWPKSPTETLWRRRSTASFLARPIDRGWLPSVGGHKSGFREIKHGDGPNALANQGVNQPRFKIATSVPVPIATPTSEAARAGASFTPLNREGIDPVEPPGRRVHVKLSPRPPLGSAKLDGWLLSRPSRCSLHVRSSEPANQPRRWLGRPEWPTCTYRCPAWCRAAGAYFVEHGRVTRIDVAVDFPEGTTSTSCRSGATTRQWRVNGKLQTYTHGKPTGNSGVSPGAKAPSRRASVTCRQ